MTKMSSLFPIAVVLGATVSTSNGAWAGSVTNAELAGKKICWSDGYAAYDKNGRRRAADLLAIRCASAI